MHIQIITFNLTGITEEQYRATADKIAPAFAEMPGLLEKYWLADPTSNTFGGVYLWTDRAAMETYMKGEVAAAVTTHPNLANISSVDFGVIYGPTLVTRGSPYRDGTARTGGMTTNWQDALPRSHRS
jgi:quinol monooxygenase YgiN